MKETNAKAYYNSTVVKTILAALPFTGLCAGILFTLQQLQGAISVSWAWLTVFDVSNLLYFVVVLVARKHCFDSQGMLVESALRNTKIIVTFIILYQWNFITYLFQFEELWGYNALFVLVAAIFLDLRMLLAAEGGILFSIFLSVFIQGSQVLGNTDDWNVIAMRLVSVFLADIVLYIMVRKVEHILLKELDALTEYDTLTHTRNRRYLANYLDKAIHGYQVNGTPLHVAYMDLDEFKHINDAYGHACGDVALQKFARILTLYAGEDNLVFRLGGDEFLILFFNDWNDAVEAVVQIQERMSAEAFHFRNEEVHITVTAGLVSYDGCMDADELLAKADTCMYSGKKKNKNSLVCG